MAIPDYQSIMLPLLKLASDRQEHRLREAIEILAEELNLTAEERKQLLPSGRKATFDDRVSWASTYLKKAGLLKSTRRGYFQITDRGLEVLKQPPARITNAFLEQFPEFVEFKTRRKQAQEEPRDDEGEQTPEEAIESVYQRLKEDLAADLLETVKGCSPTFFERLVVDLLVKMGYGGTRKEAGQAIGGTGDEGIDGNVGVAPVASYELKRIDSDYFLGE